MERFSTRLFLIKFALEGTCLTSSFFGATSTVWKQLRQDDRSRAFRSQRASPGFNSCFFIEKNRGKSHFSAGRLPKTSYFTCLERHAARLDALGPSKSIEYIEVFIDFHVFCRYPRPSNAQEPVLEPFGSHLEPFGPHLEAILEPSGSQYVEFGYDLGRYPRLSNAQEAILELFGSHF